MKRISLIMLASTIACALLLSGCFASRDKSDKDSNGNPIDAGIDDSGQPYEDGEKKQESDEREQDASYSEPSEKSSETGQDASYSEPSEKSSETGQDASYSEPSEKDVKKEQDAGDSEASNDSSVRDAAHNDPSPPKDPINDILDNLGHPEERDTDVIHLTESLWTEADFMYRNERRWFTLDVTGGNTYHIYIDDEFGSGLHYADEEFYLYEGLPSDAREFVDHVDVSEVGFYDEPYEYTSDFTGRLYILLISDNPGYQTFEIRYVVN